MPMISRRLLLAASSSAPVWPQPPGKAIADPLDLGSIPNFCAHEHWGSIDSIGRVPGGFRADVEAGAMPVARTGLADVVFEPYLRGWITSAGGDLSALANPRGLTFRELARPVLMDHRFTGV